MKVKNDHRSEFSNLSNWKEEAWKKKFIFIFFFSWWCYVLAGNLALINKNGELTSIPKIWDLPKWM